MAITAKQAIEAIEGSKGVITVIARRLGCSQRHVYNLRDKYKSVADAIEDERESMKDFAESKLFEQVSTGNMTAIIFYLKTQGEDRGYNDRLRITAKIEGLDEFLKMAQKIGVDPGDLFNAMIAEMAALDSANHRS